jgi:cytochrome c peroxidase
VKLFKVVILLFVGIVFWTCKKDPEITQATELVEENFYSQVVPKGWPQPGYKFQNNPITPEGFDLGRRIFYDPLFSEDTTLACGNCHMQIFGFTNGPSHALSHGVHDLLGRRNAPALYNLAWNNKGLRWDGGAVNLENQPLNPLTDENEMNLGIDSALARAKRSSKYKDLFKKAFGDTLIDSQRFLKALAQFTGLLVSYNSKYDKVKRGEDSFTASENNGYQVFKNKCSGCHLEPLFSDYDFRNKGLTVTSLRDSGKYEITHAANEMFKFKTPSLRNLAFTAPYMHDGRFTTLDQVLTFFTSGVSTSLPNVDPYMLFQHTISAQEKADLLNFLNTLNDYKFINEPRFSEIH